MQFDNIVGFVAEINPWVLIALGIVLGGAGVLLFALRHLRKATADAFESGLQHNAAAQTEIQQLSDDRIARAHEKHAADEASLRANQLQLLEVRNDLAVHQERLLEAQTKVAASEARLDESQKGFREKERLFRETSEQLKQEFELLANKVFDHQDVKQKESLKSVLTPFKDQIVDFKKRVEEVYHSDTKERASLLAEVRNLQTASERINEEAENLTKALKGDKKLQGNWGELVLERVLEESGLRKDHEYFVQSSQRNAEGDLKRPDVLIRLPDNKDVVIDSKVTLNSYEEALASEDDQERERLLRQHLLNMRNHVKRLAAQDYDRLPDVRSLDFVLLFVPIESAFTLAMQTDPRLFTDAFTQRIVLVSPTTLMMTLRIINNVWRYEKQNKNSQEIARRAGALYDKLRVLVEEMDTLGKQITTAGKTYESVYGKLATGKANLVRQVEQFRELGARVKKPMSPQLLEQADDES